MNERSKGEQAREILESDAFRDALANARKSLFEEWERATAQPQREALWFQLKALDILPKELAILRDRGVWASKER